MASILVSNPKDYINFPDDIIIDILTKLPVKSLIRFKRVCKSWFSLIQAEKFIKQHYDAHKNCQKYFTVSCRYKMNQLDFYHYTIDVSQLDSSSTVSLLESPVPIDQLQMVTGIQYFSSNGILLIIYADDIIVMWNPATRKSRRIPHPIQSKRGFWMPISGPLYNFCYFPCIDGYKIFRLGSLFHNDYKQIDIFSTKDNTWKSIDLFPPNYCYIAADVVITDGIVYMMATRSKNLHNGDSINTIVRFCLEKEQFQEDLLFPCPMEYRANPVLYALGEKLCLRTLKDNHKIQEFWLYSMKTNSWNKILTIPSPNITYLTPLSYMNNGGIMFQKYNGFVAYDSTTQKLEQVNVTGIEEELYFTKVVTYVETLCSPNS